MLRREALHEGDRFVECPRHHDAAVRSECLSALAPRTAAVAVLFA